MQELWVRQGTTVKSRFGAVREHTDVEQAKATLRTLRSHTAVKAAQMIVGEDLKPADLASAVDAALDAAAAQIQANDPASLPGWAQQVISLTLAAGTVIDELLEAMGVPDPDDDDND